ncbi:hypothetical protein [Mycobacterium sp. SP-6446]|uniref:hypothetical protein n=1 Tax=Mycobacterium sp. SP-6446 TaxID=1834162 RepID=UPI0011154C1A|nr:hypothetical protein [Mycobacterium sp. SP-6446]
MIHLLSVVLDPGRRRAHRAFVRYFWRYRHALATDRLELDPRDVAGWSEGPHAPPAENTTARIPEHVLGPLLVWSLRFVDSFAADILAANDHWLDHRHDPPPGKGKTSVGLRTALHQLLNEHLRLQKPLPGNGSEVNVLALARRLDYDRRDLYVCIDDIRAVAAAVGVTPHTYFDLPITARHDDGTPWLSGIATHHRNREGLATLARVLQASCYVVIAYLSGMRDSEVKHLQRGCLRTQRGEAGTPYRWKLTSRAFKGERDPAGVSATWVVGQPVSRAIAVLERLQPPHTEWLFASLPHGPGAGPASRSANAAITTTSTNNQLDELIAWINRYCRDNDRTDTIPEVNGRAFRLTTRQFRRTVAWFIARQPGGSIAGAIQYRHLNIQMFEGYAGTSESGFRAEVESEQALTRGEHLLTLANAHEHPGLAGPGAAEASRRLEELGNRARFHGITITDPHRLKRLMQRHDPAIHPGTYVTCVFNPDKALCHKQRDAHGAEHPSLSDCRPLDCRNAALTAQNAAALREEIDQIDRQLATRPALPPPVVHRITARRDQISNFLDRHAPTEPP